MYIIYTNDGFIKSVKLTDYIQKGNNNVNSIFLAIEGKTNQEWAATIIFTLPNDSKLPITPYAKTKTIEGVEYSGWQLDITAAITAFEGVVKFSVAALNLQNQTLFTYINKLVINPSIIVPDVTAITYDQYQHLLQYITSLVGDPETNRHVFRHTVRVLADDADYDGYYVFYLSNGEEINSVEKLRDVFGGENVDYKGIGYAYDDNAYGYIINISSKIVEGALENLYGTGTPGSYQTGHHTIVSISDNVELV